MLNQESEEEEFGVDLEVRRIILSDLWSFFTTMLLFSNEL